MGEAKGPCSLAPLSFPRYARIYFLRCDLEEPWVESFPFIRISTFQRSARAPSASKQIGAAAP